MDAFSVGVFLLFEEDQVIDHCIDVKAWSWRVVEVKIIRVSKNRNRIDVFKRLSYRSAF